MDHLSTMKRKNVVFVYDLLLEMLDANTSSEPDGLSDPPPPQADRRGSGRSATSPGPDQSPAPRRPAQDHRPPAGTELQVRHLQRPPPAETHGAMEGEG